MKKKVLPVLLALGVVLGQAQGVYAAVEEVPQAAVEELPQAAVEEVPQAAVEEVPQAAAEELPQAAVEEAIPEAEKAVEAAGAAPAASAAENAPKNAQDGQNKDVWIDNTVDNSVSYVTVVIDLSGSAGLKKTIVDKKEVQVTYSNPKSAEVQAIVDDAEAEVKEWIKKAKTGSYEVVETKTDGKTWDHRKYETIEDGDAVLIGDTTYIPDQTNTGTTHVASGDYGKETTFLFEIKGEAAAYELSESHVGNGNVTIEVDTELEGTNVALAGDTVTVKMKAADNNFIKTYSIFKGDEQMEAAVFGDNTEQEATTSFKMPAGDVQISAEFKEIREYTAICLGTTEGGSYSVSGNGLMNEEDLQGPIDMTVPVNGKVTLTAAADSGYVFKGWYVGIVDDSSFVHENDGTLISEDNPYTFTIPGDAVLAIQAVFEEDKSSEEPVTPPETPKDEEPPKEEPKVEPAKEKTPAADTVTEEKKESSSEKKSSKKKSAPTGDESNPMIPAALMGAAVIGIALTVGRKRRNF